MDTRFITSLENGGIAYTWVKGEDLDGLKLNKALFHLSRTTDMTTHFDPEIHTVEAIAAGLGEGFRPLSVIGTCSSADIPSDIYFRDAWDWED